MRCCAREAQLSFLQESHCDEIQGYHFSRPIEAGAVGDLLAQQKRAADAMTKAGQTARQS